MYLPAHHATEQLQSETPLHQSLHCCVSNKTSTVLVKRTISGHWSVFTYSPAPLFGCIRCICIDTAVTRQQVDQSREADACRPTVQVQNDHHNCRELGISGNRRCGTTSNPRHVNNITRCRCCHVHEKELVDSLQNHLWTELRCFSFQAILQFFSYFN